MSYHKSLFDLSTLQKLAESSDLRKDIDASMRAQLRGGEPNIPRADIRVKDKDTRSEVEQKSTRNKNLLAQTLRKHLASKGEQVSHKAEGRDTDQYARREEGRGVGQRRSESEHTKVSPNSYSHQSSYSFEKTSAVQPQNKRRLRNMRADKSTAIQYKEIIASDPIVITTSLDDLPMIPFPDNAGSEVEQELMTIQNTMDSAPLLDDTMEAVDDDPMELFIRACNALGVPADEEIAPLLVEDLRRIALTLKYVHQRPRPVEIAPYHGYHIVPDYLDSYADTPSYPSMAAMIGYGLSNLYSQLYPNFRDEFYNVGDTIAVQQIQSGQHFPSDTHYAKVVADTVLTKDNEKKASWESTHSPPTSETSHKDTQPPRTVRRILVRK